MPHTHSDIYVHTQTLVYNKIHGCENVWWRMCNINSFMVSSQNADMIYQGSWIYNIELKNDI